MVFNDDPEAGYHLNNTGKPYSTVTYGINTKYLTPVLCRYCTPEGSNVETLIELYDERPLENVLGVEMFRPARVVYICPDRVASNKRIQQKLRLYFQHRGLKVELIFLRAQIYDTDAMRKLFQKTVARYPDCAIDITGGTDAVLFAAGLLSAEIDIPVFTYSLRKNRFYDIRNAPFAANLPCNLSYGVKDCFLMAGGSMRTGRVDNAVLSQYLDDIGPFFRIYMEHRRQWVKIITYIQRISPGKADGSFSLEASGSYTVKGEQASRIKAPEEALQQLEDIGFIRDLSVVPEESVSFHFRDAQVRAWLRDVGSVLELYVYKTCLDTGLFQDVITSAVVDWDGESGRNAVTNELDVMCTRGITPVFISCKTCDAKTEALNELAILRDRFGGGIAQAAIVTAEKGGIAMRNRASELGISVIDVNDLIHNRTEKRIRDLVRD